MLYTLRLFLFQLKKYIKSIPIVLLSGLIFLCLVLVLYLGITKYATDKDEIEVASVALVTGNLDEVYLDFGLSYLENMESVSTSLNFKVMTAKEAAAALENGEVIAIISMPDGVFESILNGENKPVQIIFNDSNPLSNVFLTEMSRSGAALLSGAQAGTYTTAEIFTMCGLENELGKAYSDVDNINFKLALKRSSIFNYDSGEELLNTVSFFASSAIILICSLMGISLSARIVTDNDSFLFLGRCNKFFTAKYYITKTLSLTVIYTALIGLMLFIANILLKNYFVQYSYDIKGILLTALFMASFIQAIFFIAPKIQDGIIIMFSLSVGFELAGGLIIPSVFLPEILNIIAPFLPYKGVHDILMSCIIENYSVNYIMLFVYIITFLAGGLVALIIRLKKVNS